MWKNRFYIFKNCGWKCIKINEVRSLYDYKICILDLNLGDNFIIAKKNFYNNEMWKLYE